MVSMSLSEVYPLIQSLHDRVQGLEKIVFYLEGMMRNKNAAHRSTAEKVSESVNEKLYDLVLQWLLKKNERKEMGFSLPFSLALHKAENRVYVRVKTESDPVFYITLQKQNTYNLIKITNHGESMIIKDASPYKIFETLEQKSQEIIARNRLPKQ
jgi:hypothetical protein